MVQVGQKFDVKLRDGRGRPTLLEVVRLAGVFVDVRDRKGEVRRVAAKRLEGAKVHEYNWTRRKVAA